MKYFAGLAAAAILGYFLRNIVTYCKNPPPQDDFGLSHWRSKQLRDIIREWFIKDYPPLPDKPVLELRTKSGKTIRIHHEPKQ
jgi:hypothetical protein